MLQLRAIYYLARTELLPLLGSESTLFAYNFMNFIILLSGVHKFVKIYFKPAQCALCSGKRGRLEDSQNILMACIKCLSIPNTICRGILTPFKNIIVQY